MAENHSYNSFSISRAVIFYTIPLGDYDTLSMKQKLAVIHEVESGLQLATVALKFGVAKSTLSTIVRARTSFGAVKTVSYQTRKGLRKTAHPELEKRHWSYCSRAHAPPICQ